VAGGAAPRRSHPCNLGDEEKASSKVYLKEHRLLQEAKQKARKAGADHAGSASLYRHLCHMSEANALAEDLGLRTRYRPHRKEKARAGKDGEEVACRIYEDGELTKEVSMPFFERRFKAMQGRWNQLVVAKADKQSASATAGSKARAGPRSGSKVALPASATAASDREPSTGRPSTLLSHEAQEALQRQIKRVTLETLALADRMWQQLDGLEQDPKPMNPFVIH